MCGACHSFLFASVPVEPPSRVPDLSDDEDSGNDEPPYNAAGVNPSHSNANVPANLNAAGLEAVDRDENMDADVVLDDVAAIEDDDEVPEDMIEANVAPEPGARAAVAANELPMVRPRPSPPRNVLQYLDLLSVPRLNDKNDPRIEALATEVLLCIFSYLDDLSLASVSRVCRRWRNIVQTYTNDDMWSQYTKKRWPLFQEVARVPSWLEVSCNSFFPHGSRLNLTITIFFFSFPDRCSPRSWTRASVAPVSSTWPRRFPRNLEGITTGKSDCKMKMTK